MSQIRPSRSGAASDTRSRSRSRCTPSQYSSSSSCADGDGGAASPTRCGHLCTVALAPLPAPPPVHRADAPKPAVNKHAAPIETPDTIAKEPEFEIEVAIPAASALHEMGIVEGGTAIMAPPPPPPPARIDTPIRPGGDIKPPEKIRDVAPIYPPIAQAARSHGTVIIEAVIGVDGRVQDTRVLRSAPLLDEAALAAVRQWLYTPTRLNGQPVSVVMTVTVRFQLQ